MISFYRSGALGVALAIVAAAEPSLAQSRLASTRMELDAIPLPDNGEAVQGSSFAAGMRTAVIEGHGDRAGLYTIVFDVPPNTFIAPHLHRDDRSCFVLKGVWRFGYGAKRVERELVTLHVGGHYNEVANQPHYAATGAEGAVLECTAIGPTSTRYVNPADDPRRATPPAAQAKAR